MSRARDVASGNLALINPTSDGNLLTASSGAWVSQAPAPTPPAGNKLEAVVSGTLTNGQTVIIQADGTVAPVTGQNGGALDTEFFKTSNTIVEASCFDTTANKVVVCYSDGGDNNHGYVVIGTVTGNNIVFNTPTKFNAAYTFQIDVVHNPAEGVNLITFQSTAGQVFMARAFSISGTGATATISMGSAITVTSGVNSYASTVYHAGEQVVATIYYQNSQSRSRVTTFGFSGTLVAVQQSVNFLSGSALYHIKSVYDSGNTNIAICFAHGGVSSFGHTKTITLSGFTPTVSGAINNYTNYSVRQKSISYDANADRIVITFQSGNNGYAYAVVGQYASGGSGGYHNFGNPAVISRNQNGASTASAYDPDNQIIGMTYQEASAAGIFVKGTIDVPNTAIVISDHVQFTAGVNYYNQLVYDTNADLFVNSAHDQGNSNYGTAYTLAFPSTNLTTTNFIGFSDAAYTNGQTASIETTGNISDAQTGLTPAVQYYVQLDGSLANTATVPSVLAGTAVATTKIKVA